MSSPQAVGLLEVRSNNRLLRDAVTSQKNTSILGPRIVTLNGTACDKRDLVTFRQLQNCGTEAVKYLVDNDNNCTANNFHGILAGGSAVDDGLGSVLQLGITGARITIYTASGTPRVAVFEIIPVEAAY